VAGEQGESEARPETLAMAAVAPEECDLAVIFPLKRPRRHLMPPSARWLLPNRQMVSSRTRPRCRRLTSCRPLRANIFTEPRCINRRLRPPR